MPVGGVIFRRGSLSLGLGRILRVSWRREDMRRGEEDDEDEHDGAAWSAAAFTRLSTAGHQVFGTSIGVKAPSMGGSFRPQPIPDAEFRHEKLGIRGIRLQLV